MSYWRREYHRGKTGDVLHVISDIFLDNRKVRFLNLGPVHVPSFPTYTYSAHGSSQLCRFKRQGMRASIGT